MAEILVVDDEIGIRELLSEILGDEGHTVLLADSAREARAVRERQRVDLVLLDIWMPDTDGITLLREWASGGRLTMPVIMMSGHATIDTAAEASRIGASDFLEKPITLQKLLRAVQNGLTRPAQKPAGVPAPAAVPSAVALVPRDTGSAGAIPAAAPGAVEPPAAFGEPMTVPVAVAPAVPESPAARLLLRELPLDAPLRDARDAFERAYFEHHLMREQGSMTRVAERTGLERTHLYRKLKQLGIDLSRGVWRKPPTP
ncbi:MAG: response regulator [Betaproteobacteria bacterium]|nr:response regulator [Betaproteobacteria bacterium]